MQIANREAIKDYVNKIALQVLEREIELFTANIGGIAKVATLTMLVSWQFFLMSWKRTTWRLGLELVLPFYGCAALTFGINGRITICGHLIKFPLALGTQKVISSNNLLRHR